MDKPQYYKIKPGEIYSGRVAKLVGYWRNNPSKLTISLKPGYCLERKLTDLIEITEKEYQEFLKSEVYGTTGSKLSTATSLHG